MRLGRNAVGKHSLPSFVYRCSCESSASSLTVGRRKRSSCRVVRFDVGAGDGTAVAVVENARTRPIPRILLQTLMVWDFCIFVLHIGNGYSVASRPVGMIPNDEFPHTWYLVDCLASGEQRSDSLRRWRIAVTTDGVWKPMRPVPT